MLCQIIPNSLTSSILVAQVGESPDIAQADGEANQRQQKVKSSVPRITLSLHEGFLYLPVGLITLKEEILYN